MAKRVSKRRRSTLMEYLFSTLALLILVSLAASGQTNDPLMGTWSARRGTSDFVLVLNQGGSGFLNSLSLRWNVEGSTLSLATPKGNYRYRFSLSGDSLTLSGSNLKQPLSFTRAKAGAEPLDSAAELPVAGNPPLTEDMVNRGTQFFEWLLDAQLTQEQRAEFRGSLVRSWKNHQQEDIASTLNVLKFQDGLNSKRPEERAVIREQLREKFLALMRQTPTAVLSRWVLNIYDSAHRPIASGNPPLTPQVADAYAEFVSFMLTECLGRSVFTADRHFKDEVARSLAEQYSGYSPQQQKQFSQVPLLWEVLRLKWAQTPEDERAEYRKQWTPIVRALLASATSGGKSNQPADQASGSASLQNYTSNYSEHLFVQSMANSSFTTTMNLHLNMWR